MCMPKCAKSTRPGKVFWGCVWLLLLSATVTTADLDPEGLVLYLPCEDAANPIDASIDPTAVTVLGSLGLGAGQFGMGLEFDGNPANRLEVTHAAKLDGMSALTIEAWVLPRNIASYEGMSVASKRIANQNADSYNLFIWTGRTVRARVNATGEIQSTTALEDDTWYHLAYVFDGQGAAGEKVKLYVNGVLEASGAHPDNAVPAGGAPLWLGELDAARNFPWDGIMDEVGIWNIPLDEGDVNTLLVQSKGELFTTGKAMGPRPGNGSMIDQPVAFLSWRPGNYAVSHDAYFGESFETVSAATPDEADVYAGRLDAAMLNVGLAGGPYPDGLVPGQTYYWRVDEVNDLNPESPWKGDIWSFRVKPAIAFKPYPVDGMRNIDPNQDLTWQSGTGTIFHTIYFGQSEDEVAGAVAGGWMQVEHLYDPGTLELDTTYYWRIDEFKGVTTDKGEVWSFTTRGEGGGAEAEYFAGMELAGDPILTQIEPSINHNWSGEVAGGLEDLVSARWRANLEAPFTEPVKLITTSDDGVRLWVDGRLIIDNWTDHSSTDNTATIDMVAGQVYMIVMEWYENGGGAVAQLSWQSDTLPRQIIPQGWLQLPLKATSPSPANGAPHADQNSILSWAAGDDATGHQVYFGDDADVVANADTGTAGIYRGQQAADVTTYNPGPLEWGKTYYWRVDEVNPGGVLAGALWGFTTADFIVIDDFESYDNEVGSRPFEVWIDGFGFSQPPPGNPGNGSNATVGHDIWSDTSPHYNGLLMETGRVHGGFQSMPVDYNNVISPFYSEIERTWATPQNWTVNGVDTLTLYVRGGSANGPDRFYVTLNDNAGGSATVALADTSIVTRVSWAEVSISLDDFAGVNAAAITKMIVGVGDPPAAGGAGTLLFDDFRATKAAE